jgi:hypothetical protein
VTAPGGQALTRPPLQASARRRKAGTWRAAETPGPWRTGDCRYFRRRMTVVNTFGRNRG